MSSLKSSLNLSLGSSSSSTDNKLYKKLQQTKYKEQHYDPGSLTIDDAIDAAGDFSHYQKRTMWIFTLQYAISSFLMMGLSLLLVKPTFQCLQPDGTYQKCVEDVACATGNPEVDTGASRSTISLTFELYCGKNWIISLLGSLLFTGACLAGFFFPYIANWKGRKIGILIALLLGGGGMVIIGAAHRIEVIMVFITLVGFAFSGFEILVILYTSELSGEKFRIFATTSFGTAWAVAQILISPFFLLASTWRVVCYGLIGAPLLASAYVIYEYVFETPRFFYFQRQFAEAKDVINKICKINKKPRVNARLAGEMGEEAYEGTTFFAKRQVPPEVEAYNIGVKFAGYFDLLKNPQLRKVTLALLYIWFFRNFTYYGLNYTLPSLGTEVYQNFTYAAFAETAASLLVGKITFRMGRKISLLGSVGIASLACVMIVFFPIPDECYLAEEGCYQKVLSVILSIVAKFCVAFFANVLITYTSESYPTEVRSLGLGLTMATGRVGAIAMPFVSPYMQLTQVNPLFVFGIAGLFALVFIYFLPETFGRVMKEYVEELKPVRQPLLQINENPDGFESD